MRSSAKRWVCATLVSCLFGGWTAYHVAAQRRTSVTITRLYAGPDGQTHAVDTTVRLHPSTLRTGLEQSEVQQVSGAQFFRWPRGHVWEWHTATQRQYVITVSGQGEVEVTKGQKIPLTPGRVLLAEDVTGKGHITRVTGSEDLVLLLLPFAAQSRTADTAGTR